jgi:hypothetical protein
MKYILFILGLFFSALAYADCALNDAFVRHIEVVTSYPRVPELREKVHYQSYLDTAKAVAEEDVENRALYHDAYLQLMADQYLLLSAWIDNRILKVTARKEICSGPEGELVIMAVLTGGETKAKVIPFKKVNNQWLRSFTLTSGYSYIEENDAQSVLKGM